MDTEGQGKNYILSKKPLEFDFFFNKYINILISHIIK